MDVVSACPLRVGSILWQNGDGDYTLTVACKATYVLRQGESPLSSHQEELTEADEYWDDDEARSLHAASDLVPFKRNADVIVVGNAYAPRGQPVRSLKVHLLVGEVDKSLEIFCDRAFSLDGQLREGTRFVKMPLRWERAAGGPDTSNPVGVRADAPPDRHGLTPLPNLQPAGLYVTSRADFIEPVGLGPIAPSWPSRQAKLHAGLAGWDYRRWHAGRTPVDLDPGFFNMAPPDQQLGVLRANERIVLENLHPRHPRIVTNLAPISPRAVVEIAGGSAQELGMRCDTLWIDTDRGTCSLVWRAAIPLDHPARAGRVTITLARMQQDQAHAQMSTTSEFSAAASRDLPFGPAASAPPARPSWSEGPAPRPSAPEVSEVERTMDAPLAGRIPALPFRSGHSPLAGTAPGTTVPQAPPSWSGTPAPAGDPDGDTATEHPADVPPAPPSVPTQPMAGPAMPVVGAAFKPVPVGQLTAAAIKPFTAAAVIPLPPPPPPPPPPAPPPVAPPQATPFSPPVTPFTAPAAAIPPPVTPFSQAPVMPFAPPPVAPVAPPPAPIPQPVAPLPQPSGLFALQPAPPIVPPAPPAIVPPPAPPPIAPPPIAPPPAPPPPLIGPLATPEMVVPEEPPPAEPPAEPAAAEPPPSPPAPAPPQDPGLPLAKYPIERCAAIAASIARTKPRSAEILKEHELARADWEALSKHWQDAIRAESGRGKSKLMDAYDDAYVAQLEKERGPIQPEEYARIVVAGERGGTEATLTELGLPPTVILRLSRVWLRRTSADPELGKSTQAAIDAAREE
jgi:hypothetical protein